MARNERSAGVILFRHPPGGEPLFLLLDYGRYWDYPKGHLEKGEDDLTAARRELREETGLTACTFIPGFQHELVYFFRSRRGLVRKTVIFFLAKTETADVLLSDEHVGFAWLTGQVAMEKVTYSTARQVLSAAVSFLATVSQA